MNKQFISAIAMVATILVSALAYGSVRLKHPHDVVFITGLAVAVVIFNIWRMTGLADQDA